MTGVRPAALLACALLAGTGCATKAVRPSAGDPHPQTIVLEAVPRHVDDVMRPLQVELLAPVRIKQREAPVSAAGAAGDGSYVHWLTEVSESIVYGRELSKNFDRMSERAYRDLANMGGRPKKNDPTALDLSLLARRLHVYFSAQPAEVRKTAAAYLESVFSITG